MNAVSIDAGPLLVVQSGKGPTILLVHGVAGSHRIFDPIVPLLETDFSVVRVDLLGYGHSAKPRAAYTPEVHSRAIHDSLEASGIAGPFILLGLSMGVDVVLDYAARYPGEVADIIGVGFPYYRDRDEACRGVRANLFTGFTVDHPALASILIPLVWAVGRSVSPLARKMATIYTPVMARETMMCRFLAFKRSLLNTMIENRLEGVLAASGDRRRLFVHGGADKWCAESDVRTALEQYPRTVFEVIDGAAHNLVVLEPERLVSLIRAYLGTELAPVSEPPVTS